MGELRPHVAVGEPGSGSRECGSSVRIRLLGGFSVAVAGTPVSDPWRLRKARTLVKLLALAPGHRQPRDQVTEVLWPGASRRAGINNFHQVVHAVRRVIGPDAIALDDTVVRLNSPDVVTVDIDDFERAADDRTADLDVTLRAARLWTGQLLPEDLYADWAAEPRRRFDDLHATLIARLGRHLVEAGRVEDALAHLEPLAESRPVDEGLHRMLIRALADSGRRWDAFAAYERLRSAVDQEYAAEPEPPTRELYRRLLTGGPSSAPVAAHRLPAPTTSFVGRRRVLAELAQDLGRTRMMTLAGVGGVGKSRIALELARHQSGRAEFRDGVWLVELAGVAEPNGVAATCASALRVILPSGSDPVAALARELADRALLLVIDNCEHLLDAVSALVGELLARCLDVVVVATSREPLGLPGELIYRVPSLELPSAPDGADLPGLARLESVQLFVERARLVVPSFAVGPDTAEPVIRICRQLDGIPLALELAAARLAHRTVAELADGLVDALTVLGQQLGPRGRGRLDRQQTIGATLEWSHAMLAGDEVAAFRRLAVFAGGFDIAAAGSICGMADPAIVAAVSRLVDKSLVQADTSGTTTRYRLLEVVRQFAIARLIEAGEGDDCRRRHLRFFVAAAGDHDPDRRSVVGEPSEWFDLEQDNLRAAMSTALVEDPVQALRLAIATWRFWVNRGLIGEGARWLDSSLRAYPERSALRARALSARSVLLVRQGRDTELADIGAQIVDLLDEFGDPGERAHARHQRALLTFMAGDWGSALAQTAEGLSQSEDFPEVTASARHLAGVLALSRGEPATAKAQFEAALRALDRVRDDAPPFFVAITMAWLVDERHHPPLPFGEETVLLGGRVGASQAVGHVQIALALTERLAGHCESALAGIDRSRIEFHRLGDRYGEAYAWAQRGHTLRWDGQHAEADRCLAISESLRRDLRDHRAVAMALMGRGLNAAVSGDAHRSRVLGREALAMMSRSEDRAGSSVAEVNLAVTEVIAGDLPAALACLDRSLLHFPIPGGHRSLGWLQLLRAHALGCLGDMLGAQAALTSAETVFERIGERSGLAAVQRRRKAGAPNLQTGHQARGRRHDTPAR